MRHLYFGLAVLALAANAHAKGNWRVESVVLPPPWYAVSGASIATDAICRPHMALALHGLSPASVFGLGYAELNGDSWTLRLPMTGTTVLEPRLRLDAYGVSHIGYIEGREAPPYLDSVRYARSDGDTWHFETVTGPGRYSALTMNLTRDNTPHMVFKDSLLRYAYKTGTTWTVLTVPTEQADTLRWLLGASLALDTNDRPGIAISWYKRDCAPGNLDSVWLAVIEFDGQNWHRFEADSGQGWSVYDFWRPKLQCDPATNLFHIVYRFGQYVTGRGRYWQGEWAGVSLGHGDFVLHQGRAHTAVGDNWCFLRHQWRWAGGWEEELVDTMTPDRISLAVDRTGLPHIAFTPFAMVEQNLFYARRRFVGMQEPAPARPVTLASAPTVIRGVLNLSGLGHNPILPGESGLCPKPALLDISGRKVMDLQPGENDVRHLAPGVYFIRAQGTGVMGQETRKVVIQR